MSNNLHSLPAKDRVALARHQSRPNVRAYIGGAFTDFLELHGDRAYGDDGAVVGGVARFGEIPVTVIGHLKENTLEKNIACNFGMPNPEGYRKALRLMKQAEKFGRPIITFIDTPGAYPGIEAEERGQAEAIARNLMEMSALRVPVISIVIGEGGSGGALALGVADKVIMLENAVYSVLSPEGFASILWKDASRSDEACDVMKLTAQDLFDLGVCDDIVREPDGGAHMDVDTTVSAVSEAIKKHLAPLLLKDADTLVRERYEKYKRIGAVNFI